MWFNNIFHRKSSYKIQSATGKYMITLLIRICRNVANQTYN